jgi:hypothetical protein
MLPWCSNAIVDLRRLRLDIYLPEPYNKTLWVDKLTKQLSVFMASVQNGRKLKAIRILIATWHNFRELSDWQTLALETLQQLSVRGHAETRTKSLNKKLSDSLREVDLSSKVQDPLTSHSSEYFVDRCEVPGRELDWDWEGAIVI